MIFAAEQVGLRFFRSGGSFERLAGQGLLFLELGSYRPHSAPAHGR